MSKTKADLEREVSELRLKLGQSSGVPPKEREASEARANDARAAVSDLSVESVVQDITDVGLSTSKVFANLTGVLTEKTKQLETIDLAIKVKTQDIENLYNKEIVGSSLAALIEDHDRQKVQLQADIMTTRQQWSDEKSAYAKQVQERNIETDKLRAREEDKFSYERNLTRREVETVWKNTLEDQKRAEALRAADIARDHQDRETALKAREADYVVAQTRVAGIQGEIDAAVKKEVAIVTNALSRDHRHATELVQKDHQSQMSVVQAQLSAVKLENERLAALAADLNGKLSDAYSKNTSLSEKALDAASGRQALSELRDLSLTRAENNGNIRKS